MEKIILKRINILEDNGKLSINLRLLINLKNI